MNSIMYGRQEVERRSIVYGAFDVIEGKLRSEPLPFFKQALDNVAPSIEVRSRRVGGATYQVPWKYGRSVVRRLPSAGSSPLRAAANDKTMVDRLSAELMDAANNRGNAVKKREDTHRMAEANRAFSHYRW